jgi:hypothetical protein
MRRTLLALSLALPLPLFAAGCDSPSVPLPPPDLTSFSFGLTEPGLLQVTGAANPRHSEARMYFYNLTGGEGNITTAGGDGSFLTDPFPGVVGDRMQMYYDRPDGERSEGICGDVQLGVTLTSIRCF